MVMELLVDRTPVELAEECHGGGIPPYNQRSDTTSAPRIQSCGSVPLPPFGDRPLPAIITCLTFSHHLLFAPSTSKVDGPAHA